MRWFISVIIMLGLLAGSVYGLNQYQRPVYVPVSYTADYIAYLRPDIDPEIRQVIAQAIDINCWQYGLDAEIVTALIARESSFLPWAKSKADCVGLMQVNPRAHKDKCKGYSQAELYHIPVNVEIGCKILREYMDKSKSVDEALGRYMGCQGAVSYKRDILATAAELYARRG
jgi:soluble lytic murein transglycosylase-like protein